MSHQSGPSRARPLSPHLQVYRWRLHMAVSVFHRITGTVLLGGAFLLTWFLIAMATGYDYFHTVLDFAGSIVGRLVLFGLTLALMQHLASGIRHLFMDTGALFDLKKNTSTALATFIFSVASSLIIWIAAYAVMGQA